MIIRRYMIAGLLIWLPILATIFVFRFLIGIMDSTINLLPKAYQPAQFLGIDIPGFGLVFTLVILFFTGMLVTNFIGRRIEGAWDKLVSRIPFVRLIHHIVKQVLQTLFSNQGKAFRRALLVEYPRKGMWSIAFQTGEGFKQISEHLEDDIVTIFIPTTPNPTSGFLMMVRASDTIEVDMNVDEVLKFVISLGVMQPSASVVSKKFDDLSNTDIH